MRQRGPGRFDRAMRVMALVSLLLCVVGTALVRAQEATPVAGGQPVPGSIELATLTPTPTPIQTPTMAATTTPATPAPKPRTLAEQASVVPSLSATDFSPASSTLSFPQGYSTATKTANVTLFGHR